VLFVREEILVANIECDGFHARNSSHICAQFEKQKWFARRVRTVDPKIADGNVPSPKYKRSDYKPDDNADNNANDEIHVIPPK
jgi:hypothetical protein